MDDDTVDARIKQALVDYASSGVPYPPDRGGPVSLPTSLRLVPHSGLCVAFCAREDTVAWVCVEDGQPVCWDGFYTYDGEPLVSLDDFLAPSVEPQELAVAQRRQMMSLLEVTMFPLLNGLPVVPFLRVRSTSPSWGRGTIPTDLLNQARLVGLLVLS